MERETNLFQVVFATGFTHRFSHGLDGRQQQTDQDADDGDHHQQFDRVNTIARMSLCAAYSFSKPLRVGLIDRNTLAIGGVGTATNDPNPGGLDNRPALWKVF